MIIKNKRIRNLKLHLPGVEEGASLVFALKDLPAHQKRVEQSGLPSPLTSGHAVLPKVIGPVSRFNAEGKFLIHRDQPKETVYYVRDWTHKEWHGDVQEEVTSSVEFSYQRYPRTFVPPPSLEFKLATTTEGELILVTDRFCCRPEHFSDCLHAINVILEYFGECYVLDENLDSIISVEVKRLHWDVLPPGSRPWKELKDLIKDRIERFESDCNSAFRVRLDYVNSFSPVFAAVGRAGFNGYVVFGFPDKKLYVCESIYKYNATYVFDRNWEELTKLTKSQILDQHLQKDRILHTGSWQSRVRALLK
jgi:hypothetical protein